MLWGAGTPGAGASFWDTVPTPTWAAGNSSQPVPNRFWRASSVVGLREIEVHG
jgi:hypothetical protein